MKKNFKLVTVLMALMLTAAFVTGCKPGKGDPEAKMNWMVEKVTGKLELDKDQENKLRDLFKTVQELKQAQKEKHLAEKEKLKAMLLSDKLDKETARKLFNDRQKTMSDSFDPIFEKLQAFHSSLTAEQKKEATQILEKFEKRFH